MPAKTKSKEEVLETSPEREKVAQFRYTWLRSAGWSEQNAWLLAGSFDVDWHVACDIRSRCQDEKLLLKVLL